MRTPTTGFNKLHNSIFLVPCSIFYRVGVHSTEQEYISYLKVVGGDTISVRKILNPVLEYWLL
ncbi:MAG: hypothetical protein ABI402_19940, partial [Ferruginibacter sp.]